MFAAYAVWNLPRCKLLQFSISQPLFVVMLSRTYINNMANIAVWCVVAEFSEQWKFRINNSFTVLFYLPIHELAFISTGVYDGVMYDAKVWYGKKNKECNARQENPSRFRSTDYDSLDTDSADDCNSSENNIVRVADRSKDNVDARWMSTASEWWVERAGTRRRDYWLIN